LEPNERKEETGKVGAASNGEKEREKKQVNQQQQPIKTSMAR